jgi:hypothetical protein
MANHNPGDGMTGYLHTINRRRGLAAIATEGSGFTILELVGGDPISIGDQLQWPNDTALGRTVYRNLTTGTDLQVNVLRHGVPESKVRQQLRL